MYALDAYTREDFAIIHRRCMLGADVVECELHETLTASVRDDLMEFEDVEDTLVVPLEDIDEE